MTICKVWDADPRNGEGEAAVIFTYRSADGEEHYPGNLDAAVRYALTAAGELRIEMSATADAPTLVNLAQHAYFNLNGQRGAPVLDHEMRLYASHYTPVDDTLIPTGQIAPVAGTGFDFTATRPIRSANHGDYDINFVVDGESIPGRPRPVADVHDPASGRTLRLEADQPGVQLFTAGILNGSLVGKCGVAYPRFGGFCLETQVHPDAINTPDFPSPVLRPGQTYRHTMVMRFSTE